MAKDTLVIALRKKIERERRQYKNLVMAHARALEENEQLKDALALQMRRGQQRDA